MSNPSVLRLLIVCLVLTVTFLYFFKKPFIWLVKSIFRGAFGSFIIFLLNFLTISFNFTMGLNPLTFALCGIFGIYGIFANYIIKIIMGM